jgi:hypothetical protein
MIDLQWPGPSGQRISPPGATVENGMGVVVRERTDLMRLVRLCSSIRRRPRPWSRLQSRTEASADDRLRQLLGSLLAGAPAVDGEGSSPGEPEAPLPQELNPDDAFEALLLGLLAVVELWPPDETRMALCLGLAMPDAGGGAELSIRFAEPRAAFWIAPGSLLAGLSVGTVLKALKWGIVVVSTFTSASAEAAARTLVENLRTRAGLKSTLHPLPRLDELAAAERSALRERPVLVVFLHGLFGTDLKTFDGFIKRLWSATFEDLDASLTRLASDAPLQPRRPNAGVEALHERFSRAAAQGAERARRTTDIEIRRFIERHVGLVGWPHDSLAPIETSATALAALLTREFGAGVPKHVVFVCHSQGGLLARATAVELAQMKAPAAKWLERVAAIATFGTPHEGAAIAEPGAQGGREMALYLMMLIGTRQAASAGDVLTLLGERSPEGLEDLKPFNASTPRRKNAYVRDLLKTESALEWPGGKHRPDMLLVGGRLDAAQEATWSTRLSAAFIDHKLRHRDHDLVVELSSSTWNMVDSEVRVTVASDHLSYFDGAGDGRFALDVPVALVWALLGDEIAGWCVALEADDKLRTKPMPHLKLGPRRPPPDPATEP